MATLPVNTLIIDTRNWGISDDTFVGIAGSHQAMESCEIRRNPKSIKLQFALAKDTWALAPTGYFHCWVAVSNGKTLMFTSTGEIFVNISWTRTLGYTHTGNAPILWAAEYNGYVYYATATKLHRVLLATIAATFTPTDLNRATFTEGNTSNHPMLSSNLYLYIWDGKYVATVQSTVFEADTLIFPSTESVRQLTRNGASTRVYTRNGSNDYGKCYYWDGTSDSTEQNQELSGKIHVVSTKDSVDYMIMWSSPVLYYYPYQKQGLKRVAGYLTYPNNILTYGDNILFGWTWVIYSRGALNKDYPEVLNLDYKTSTASSEVTCLVNQNGTLYAWRKNGSTYAIDKLSTSVYATTGFFTTRAFRWEAMRKNKYWVEVYIVHKPLIANETIQIYTQTNLAGGYTLRQTITGATSSGITKFKINYTFELSELKVVLNSVSPYTATPEIYQLYLRLEESQ